MLHTRYNYKKKKKQKKFNGGERVEKKKDCSLSKLHCDLGVERIINVKMERGAL